MKTLQLLALFMLAFIFNASAQVQIASSNYTNVVCFGDSNGTITLTASMGTPPYQYGISGPINSNNTTGNFANLPAGSYTIAVADALFSTATAVIGVGQPIAINANASLDTIAGCPSNQMLTMRVYVNNGGIAPFTYSCTNNNVKKLFGTSSNLFRDSFATHDTVYTFKVTDALGCVKTDTIDYKVPVVQPMVMVLQNLQNVNCYGGANGSVSFVTAGGYNNNGNSSYYYNIFPNNGFVWNGNAYNLNAGAYTITVDDGCGAQATDLFVITEPNQLTVNTSTTNVLCNGISNGTATIYANGGTPPYYYYTVSGGIITGNMVSSLLAGTYTIITTDANGCSAYTTAIITQPQILNVTTSIYYSGGQGIVQVNASGGITPYTGTGTFTLTANSTYTYTVTDANGCTNTSTIVCNIPSSLSASILTQINPSCAPNNNGSVQIAANSGTVPYTYAWSNGATTATNIALTAGTYTCIVTDAVGDTTSIVVNLVPSVAPTLSIGISNNIYCFGGNNASAYVVVNGGVAPYIYNWSNGQTTQTATGLIAGAYTCSVIDANGCSANTTVLITQPSPLNASVTYSPIKCFNGITNLNINVNGGSPAYNLVVNGSNYFPGYTVSSGIYTLSVTDANNCTYTTTTSILPSVATTAISNNFSVVNGLCTSGTSSASAAPSGGIAPYTYLWSPGGNTTNAISNLANGQTILVTTDNLGCTKRDTAFIYNNTFNITSTKDTLCIGQASNLNITYNYNGNTFGLPTNNFKWYPAASLNTNTGLSVIATPTVTTTYTIVSTNTLMCTDTIFKTIKVLSNTLAGYSIAGSVINSSCPLSTDGQVSIATTPVATTLNYIWSNGASTPSITNIGIGAYNVNVTDGVGCYYQSFNVLNTATNCGNINGVVKIDANYNCLADGTEQGLANALLTLGNGNITFANNNGAYSFIGVPYGTQSVTLSNNVSGFKANCGTVKTTTLSNSNANAMLNFTDTFTYVLDYSIYTWGGCMLPAFTNNNRLLYYGHNAPNYTTTNTIYYVFDSITHFDFSVPSPTSVSGDTAFWQVNINNGGWYNNYIDIHFDLAGLPMGLNLPYKYGYYNTSSIDTILYNNSGSGSFGTCVSYDPNDKLVSPQGKTSNGYITNADSVLTYTIRFQNTGTATAANVIVTDSMSSNLNLSSFKVLGASHNYNIEVVNNSVVKFKFLNIMLPDSMHNEPASHGFVTYQINQKPNAPVLTTIKNTANIYFDYNAPIITNTTVNTIYKRLIPIIATGYRNTNCNTPCGNGLATINNIGGLQPVVISINPSCSATSIVGNTIDKLKGGTYTIQALDALGDSYTTAVVIANPIPLNTAVTTTAASTGNNGTATATVTGGTAPYDYLWLPTNATGSGLINIPGGTYSLSVIDAQGCSDTVIVIVAFPANITTATKNNWLKIYPNPANDVVTIQSAVTINAIEIFTTTGQLVKSINTQNSLQTKIDVSNLTAGVYFIKINGYALQKTNVNH